MLASIFVEFLKARWVSGVLKIFDKDIYTVQLTAFELEQFIAARMLAMLFEQRSGFIKVRLAVYLFHVLCM